MTFHISNINIERWKNEHDTKEEHDMKTQSSHYNILIKYVCYQGEEVTVETEFEYEALWIVFTFEYINVL